MFLDKIRKVFRRTQRAVEIKVMVPLEDAVLEDHGGTGITSSSFRTVLRQENYHESWNGEPPEASWKDTFDIHCHRFPPPFERRSAPPAGEPRRPGSSTVRSSRNFELTDELTRLRNENETLADHLERTDQELSETRQAVAEEEQALRVIQQTLYDRQDEVVHLRRENQKLRLMAGGLITTKKDSKKTLRAKLAEVDLRAAREQAEVERLRMALQDSLHQKRALEQDAWELWDAIIATGAQAGVHDRRGRALSRMSLRFE